MTRPPQSTPNPRLSEALSDRYVIDREVGAGGMATVFLANDIKHERKVAVKVLRPELAAAMGAERFPREIKTVAQFNHPHILSLYDSGESAGFLYYVMPFVEGESLRERLSREHQLPVPDAVRILREVADALSYAHARGVVHRDIKPANVMLQGRHAIVTDFGVAKALSASGGDKLTTVGIAVGTPQYMAPEQAMGQDDVDHRADIYALGILGFEMIAGRPPFDASNPQALLAAHVMEPAPDLGKFRAGLHPGLVEVIMRCLAKNPADRWQSADEIVSRLEMVGSTPSGGMTPTDTRPFAATAARLPKRPTGALVALGGLLLVSAVAIVVLVMQLGDRGGAVTIDKIGVMPIEDISGQDSLFVRAMQDALVNALVRADVADVAPRSSMARYGDGSKSTREIAAELDLGAIVEATVFRAGDVMRVNVQFSDPVTSRALWSDTYELNVTDVLAAQTDVVARITSGIGGALAGDKNPGADR